MRVNVSSSSRETAQLHDPYEIYFESKNVGFVIQVMEAKESVIVGSY